MPKRTDYPIPKMRWHNCAWQIIWRWNRKQYSVSTGLTNEKADKVFAGIILRQFAGALSSDSPTFPDKYADSPGVTRYLDDRSGGTKGRIEIAGDWLETYRETLASECESKAWVEHSMRYLGILAAQAGSIQNVTPTQAQSFLNSIIMGGNSPATRNRTLAACNRFFKWAIRLRLLRRNPFEGVKTLKEERRIEIVHCTSEERAEIITLAKDSGWPDWMAVPIAFYTGLRREEVSRLGWEDIRIGEGLVVVRKAKTGKGRVLPLAAALEKILADVPAGKRRGPVVVTPEGVDRLFRLDNLARHIRRMKRERMLAAWNLPRPTPSKSKEYREKAKVWKKAKAVKDAEIAAALERIGWNAWRHTFGSLLAQAGVSIDKISAWMGNTPEVCRRHYAQFVPRDRRDEEIDKL